MAKWQVNLTFTEEILGTLAGKPDVATDFILSKRPDGVAEDEAAALLLNEEEALQNATTLFARNSAGQPILWDYQIKGFFKDACGMSRRVEGSASSKEKAYKKVIDGLIFVSPRHFPIILPSGMSLGLCERPLRARTAQGERIALARSETCPVGSTIEFTVMAMIATATAERLLKEWFDYGSLRGLGQWRNGGKGTFSYKISLVE